MPPRHQGAPRETGAHAPARGVSLATHEVTPRNILSATRMWNTSPTAHPIVAPCLGDLRLRVLRLVEQGKIDLEQASELLAAREGH